MSSQAIALNSVEKKSRIAWIAILSLVILSVLSIVSGLGKILNFAFPVGAVMVSGLLYFRYPILYLGFTWWIWFLTPVIRRLVDYRSGFTDPSPILLTPYLVTAITFITLYKNLPKTHSQGGLPFILSLASLLNGFFIGLINKSVVSVGIALLDWLVPILLGFHLFVNWRQYPSYRQNIQRTFVWAVLIMGVYGIFQYLLAPEWDRFWLINADISSAGRPFPLEIRVWSTMNSPGPFADLMMVGLLLLFVSQNSLRIPASSVGYLSFLLSLVRSAWLGWFVGVLTLTTSLKSSLQIRLILTIVAMLFCIIPLVTIEPFSGVIFSRLESFSNLTDDGSAQARQETYANLLDSALSSFHGEGIGGSGHDSALLMFLLHLGWLGTIFYMGGILLLLLSFFQGNESKHDPFISSLRAITLALFVQLPLGTPMLGVRGVALWSFLGLGMAARRYYEYQCVITRHE